MKLFPSIAFSAALTVSSLGHAQLSMLRTSANQILNQNLQPVVLKGVNLGSLFIMEPYMSPVPQGPAGKEADSWSIVRDLERQYGRATAVNITDAYQRNWISDEDMRNIRSAGFNAIRIPVWWGQFYNIDNVSPSGWRRDAFNGLDRIVNAARAAGLYSIIDMHGAVESQSFNASTGRADHNRYWYEPAAQKSTDYMWDKIARHYAGDNAIAGYDLLNEPDARSEKTAKWSASSVQKVLSAYDHLYQTVRHADSGHIIFIEDTFNHWDLDMLPDPEQRGWKNVVYELHIYPWFSQHRPQETHLHQVSRITESVLQDVRAHRRWNVPFYIGEFNALDISPEAWVTMVKGFEQASLSWSLWSYKSSNSPAPNYWGLYDRKGWAGTPNITGTDASDVSRTWAGWTTSNAFKPNTMLIQIISQNP